MPVRAINVGGDDAMAAEAMAAAQKAQDRADNVRQMVLKRDERFDTVDDRIKALGELTDAQAAHQVTLDNLAASYAQAVQSSTSDRADLRALITGLQADRTNLNAAVTALQAAVTTGQAGDKAQVDALTARVSAEVARLEAIDATEKARATAAEAALKAKADTDRQDAETARAALAARLVALETRMPAVTSGRAAVTLPLTILGGGTYNITVPFDAPAPDTSYLPMPVLDSNTIAVYSALDVVGIDQRTTTSCRVTVKNTTLISVVGTLAVTVIALKV